MSGPPTVTNDAARRAPRRRAPLAREQPARLPRVAGSRRRPRRARRPPRRRRRASRHPRRHAPAHDRPARPCAHAHGRRAAARPAARARPADTVAWARHYGATDVGLKYTLVDETVIEAARAAGVAVGVWTVNEEPDMRRLIALGVDVLTSDRPDLALRALGRA